MAYQHSYAHQQRLTNAIRKLYKLGRRDTTGSQGGDFDGIVSGMGSMLRQHPKPQDPTMKNSIKQQTMDASIKRQTMQNAIEQGVGENWQRENPPPMPEGVNWGATNDKSHPMRLQLQNQQVSDTASLSPIAGEYTAQGRRKMVQDVENNAHDITLSKQLIGMAGSKPGMGGY